MIPSLQASDKYPMLMQPVFKDYLWGGTRLKNEFGKRTEIVPLAESWEISCHRAGLSVIVNGSHAGSTLLRYISQDPASILGFCQDIRRGFPILVKFIDTAAPLSIQVHPDDRFAALHEHDSGKTEVWVVLDAAPGASIVYGLNQSLSREQFLELAAAGRIESVLHRQEVRAGDVILIPPGTLHSLGSGILVAEIQQNSDVTYRVWDYNRASQDGRPRPLHIEKAALAARLSPTPVPAVPHTPLSGHSWAGSLLAECDYFRVYAMEVSGAVSLAVTSASFMTMTCVSGTCELSWGRESLRMSRGATVFVPAGTPEFKIAGQAALLCADCRRPGTA